MVGSDHFVKSFLTIVKNDLTVWCCLIIVFMIVKSCSWWWSITLSNHRQFI